MRKHNKEKSPVNIGSILIRIALVLLVLTAISIYMLGGVLARYVTTDSSTDSARVIQFGDLTLTETGDFGTNKGMIIPGVPLTKDATVHFDGSEAATVVFAELILSDNWMKTDNTFAIGDNISWSVADGWTYLTANAYEGGKRYIYYRELAPNTELTADIIAEDGKITVSEEMTAAEINALTAPTISLRAGVIQSGGFDSVTDAWTALDSK